ncbi:MULTISPECIES: hypothetical protein [unclassified Streptomyces]|uniref:hypothetical protein n=1 Tax=unclassified Streptomyces TaxID=2593676 RepID=UPI002E2BF23C|nr:hypothetical protein [Streptomyces sp. NBC_00223]
MTAPLTPQEQPPQYPPYPGWGSGPGGDDGGEHDSALDEIGRGVMIALLVAISGVVLGLVWLWLSPRIPMVSDGQAVYLKDTEGEEAIGGDGTFVLIAVVLGVLTAAAVFWRYRKGGVGTVLGLAAGGALASVIGWRLGVWLGPPTDIVAHATELIRKAGGAHTDQLIKEHKLNVAFDGPLALRAKSALVAWPAAAMLTHLALTSAFGPRDPAPAPPPPGPLGGLPTGSPVPWPAPQGPPQPGPVPDSGPVPLDKPPAEPEDRGDDHPEPPDHPDNPDRPS